MKTIILAIAVGVCAFGDCRAEELELHDTLLLKSGSQLTGSIIEVKTENNREYVIFRTTTGNIYKLDSKLLVKRINQVDPEYQQKLAQMDQKSAAAQQEMYDWCRERSKEPARPTFKREMEYHLRQIVELDPTDERAMRLLGFDRFDGQMLHEDHNLAGHGYVRITGGWIPEKFLDVLNRERQEESIVNEKKSAFAKWTRQIGKESDRVLADSLNEIMDNFLVPVVYEKAVKEDRDNIRLIYVNAIGQVVSSVAQNALVHFAVRDPNQLIREQASSLLQQPQFDKSSAAVTASVFLRDKDRVYLLRAANLIGELNQISAFSPLVESLRTTHEVAPADDPRRMNSAFNSGGGQPNTFSFGGNNKPVKRTFENNEVRTALQRITGQHFGFEPEPWKAWYISQYTIDRYDVSEDE